MARPLYGVDLPLSEQLIGANVAADYVQGLRLVIDAGQLGIGAPIFTQTDPAGFQLIGTRSVTRSGEGFLGASATYVSARTTAANPSPLIEIPANSDWTAQFVIDNISGVSGTNHGFFRGGNTFVGTTFIVQDGSTRRPWVRVNGTDVLRPGSGVQWTTGQKLNLIVRFRNASRADAWFNGRQQFSATHSASQDVLQGTAGIHALLMQNTNEITGGNLTAFRFWTRYLDDAQTDALANNEHALYDSQHIWVPVAAGTPGAFTLTADSGTYSLTGQDAGLTATRTLTADQGTYAVTGQDASLIRAVRLLADQGSYSLAGQDVALRAARLIGAEQGSYSITGQDATLTYSPSGAYTLTADSGTYSISGQDATLSYVPLVNYTLTADAGSYAITGQTADLIYTPLNDYVLTADAGFYSIAGQDAALRYSGAPAGGGFPGFDVRTVDGPRMWWQRKPKKISEEEAEEKLEEVAEVIAKKAEAHAKAKKPKKARTAEVVEEIRPILAEMPGFDWRPMYEAAYQAALDDEISRALRAQDVQQMSARELERIRRIQDDEDVLLIAAMM